jgi:hypothetical protein
VPRRSLVSAQELRAARVVLRGARRRAEDRQTVPRPHAHAVGHGRVEQTSCVAVLLAAADRPRLSAEFDRGHRVPDDWQRRALARKNPCDPQRRHREGSLGFLGQGVEVSSGEVGSRLRVDRVGGCAAEGAKQGHGRPSLHVAPPRGSEKTASSAPRSRPARPRGAHDRSLSRRHGAGRASEPFQRCARRYVEGHVRLLGESEGSLVSSSITGVFHR